MKIKQNIVLAFIGLLLVVGVLVAIYMWDYTRIDYSTIDYIRGLQKAPNNFLDLSGDIDVHSYEDLGYEVKGEYDILIHYGKQIVKVNKQCLESDEWRSRVGEIGIKVYSRLDEETGERLYRITYWNNDIEEWSRVD